MTHTMKLRVLFVAGSIAAMTLSAGAQDGLRSASLPERPIATQPPGPEDVFRAGPDTYRRRPSGRPGHPALGGVYWPAVELPYTEPPRNRPAPTPQGGFLQIRIAPDTAHVYVDGIYEGTAGDLRWPGRQLRAGIHALRIEAPGHRPRSMDVRIVEGETLTYDDHLERADAPSPPVASVTPPARKTMYVIPRCYAGDKPPDPSTPCDRTKLRRIR